MSLEPTTLIGLITGIGLVGVMYVQTVHSCLTKRFRQRDPATGECVPTTPDGKARA
jgi:hypothetical protein